MKTLMLVILLAAFTFGKVQATTIDNPIEWDASLTTATLSLASNEYVLIDVVDALGLSQQEAEPGRLRSMVLAISVVDAPTTASVRYRFAWGPLTADDVDGSTPGRSGVTVDSGTTIYTRTLGRWLGIHGDHGDAHVRTWRAR
jgi:hypothetical protein